MIDHKQSQLPPSSQSGFTIIESLVAVVVAGILLAAIAPVIVLSVATRVQARRVELATDAAKSYIDGVRTGTIEAPFITKKSSPSDTTDPPPPDAPSGTLTCPSSTAPTCSISTSPTSYKLYCFPGDAGSCTNDKAMIVQAFGYNQTYTDAQHGYKLGLRVYRADAFKTGITLKALKDTGIQRQQTFTGGTGLTSIQAPLVEMTTEISNGVTTFSDFCDRLKQPTPSPSPTASPTPTPQSQC